jgi:hypothetical protein
MKYAVIENGVVTNVAVATPEVAAERGWVECPPGVGIGWTFDGAGEPLPPPPDVEGESARVRAERDRLLVESDVMVLPDRWAAMTQEQQAAWATYRSALRDIPQQTGFPWGVEWPQQPE